MNCMLNFKLVGPKLAVRYVIQLRQLVDGDFYEVLASRGFGGRLWHNFDFLWASLCGQRLRDRRRTCSSKEKVENVQNVVKETVKPTA